MPCFPGSSEFKYHIFRIVDFLFCIRQHLPEQGLPAISAFAALNDLYKFNLSANRTLELPYRTTRVICLPFFLVEI